MASLGGLREKTRNNPGRIGLVAALAAALVLAACAPSSKPILLDSQPKADLDRKWEKYGAYYQVDEFFVETSYLTSPFVNTTVNKFIINKSIKILTPEGARFGTVEVPVYGSMTSVFRLSQWDSSGNPVKLTVEPLRAEYLKKGKIIFPNVTPGSVLQIYIEFSTNTPVTTLEHWFSGPIPVAEGRFTFSYLDVYGYEFKAYGPVSKAKTQRTGPSESLTYQAWEVKDAYPRSNVDFQDDIDATEPRVALAIRNFHSQQIYESWENISEQYEKYVLKTSFFHSTSKLKKLVDSLTRNQPTDLAKASAAFAWVQKNISFKSSGLDAINPDRVVSSGQGNMWEMAVVLREMFDHLGLTTDILVTRPRSHGGFDPTFVSPAQLGVTLVTVKIGKVYYLAFPWSTGAALGEFPLDYMGLKALSLSDRSATSLPEYAGERAFCRNTLRFHPEEENSTVDMEMETGGYLAFSTRNSLMELRKKDIEETYQRILTGLGRSNGLQKCQVEGLEKPGTPIKAELVFSNPNQTIARKGEIQMRLSHVFMSFFSSYDTTRSSGFKNNLDIDYSETLHVPKIPGKILTPSIQCRDIANPLFRLTCSTENTPEEFIFKRLVTVNRKTFNANEIHVLARDIQELNRIQESSLLWKTDAGEHAPPGVRNKTRK